MPSRLRSPARPHSLWNGLSPKFSTTQPSKPGAVQQPRVGERPLLDRIELGVALCGAPGSAGRCNHADEELAHDRETSLGRGAPGDRLRRAVRVCAAGQERPGAPLKSHRWRASPASALLAIFKMRSTISSNSSPAAFAAFGTRLVGVMPGIVLTSRQ